MAVAQTSPRAEVWRRAVGHLRGQIAIFGAGQHTQRCMGIIHELLSESLRAFIDEAATEGQIPGGVPVMRPDEIDAGDFDAIVVSSDWFEAELAARSAVLFGSNVPVIRLYEPLRASLAPIVVATLPKSGTNWLVGMLRDEGLGGVLYQVPQATLVEQREQVERGDVTPLRELRGGQIFWGHFEGGLTESIGEVLDDRGIRCICLHRDPRDTIVSGLHYYRDAVSDHLYHDVFRRVSDEEAMAFYVTGGEVVGPDGRVARLPSLGERCRVVLDFLARPETLAVGYDDLRQDAGRELGRVLDHVGFDGLGLDVECERIAGDHEFERKTGRAPGVQDIGAYHRRGISGEWRERLTSRIRDLVKEHAGREIVELGYEADSDW